MKKIILALLMAMFLLPSQAKEITLLNNGKPGGSSDARTKLYHSGLEQLGYKVNYENIGKMAQAVDFFTKYDKPVMMVYYNLMSGSQSMVHTKDNYVALEYIQPMYVCTAVELDMLPKDVTVAYGKNYNPDMVRQIIKATGKNPTVVPYKNSSAVLEAILGGDVDIAFNNQGKSLKFIKSGKGSCFGHTGNSEAIGVQPLTKNFLIDFELPIMIATVVAKNVDIAQLRKDVHKIILGDGFVEYHTSKHLQTYLNSTLDEEFKLIKESEKLWK